MGGPPAAPGPQAPPPEAPGYGGPVPPGGWQSAPPAARPPLGELASWGVRFAAWIIDGFIVIVPTLLLGFVLLGGAIGISGDDTASTVAVIGAVILWFLLFLAVALFYAPLLMIRDGRQNGQTWGKQLLGIRVVRDSGEQFGFGQAALREIVLKDLAVGIASSIIPVLPFLADYLWPLWDDSNRALHDMGASTHVVKA